MIVASRLCYVGVESSFGPHVTPQLFATAAGRFWIVTSIGSVKARSIRRRPEVGLLLRDGDRSLVVNGRAEILSVWSPQEAARLARQVLPAFEGVAALSIRNLPTMLGYALDLCRMPAGALPLDRVLVSILPTGGALIAGNEVIERWSPDAIAHRGGRRATVSETSGPVMLPREISGLLRDRTEAAVGWMAAAGPCILPATWDPHGGIARVPSEVMRVLRSPATSPACVTLDDSTALRPTRFRGVMLRGAGRASPGDGGSMSIELAVERATWWKGFRTETVQNQTVGTSDRRARRAT